MKIGIFRSIGNINAGLARAAVKYSGEMELINFEYYGTDEDVSKIENCDAVVYTPWRPVTEHFWKTLAEKGVKYVLTPTAGYDHFNLELIKKYNMKATYVPRYSPNSVAEHTVMMVLSLLRNLREQIHDIDENNFRLPSKVGKEIREQTIGIVGAGRIALTTMECLSGFNPVKIYAYDLYKNDEVRKYAQYVELDELYAKSDIIIFHCNLTDENYHMINDETIAKLKDGVCLVNVARGGLFDSKALLKGIESGKIGGLALDVIDEELALKGSAPGTNPINELAEMLKHKNVLFTMHSAFFTNRAFEDMFNMVLENAHEYLTTGSCQNELIK